MRKESWSPTKRTNRSPGAGIMTTGCIDIIRDDHGASPRQRRKLQQPCKGKQRPSPAFLFLKIASPGHVNGYNGIFKKNVRAGWGTAPAERGYVYSVRTAGLWPAARPSLTAA